MDDRTAAIPLRLGADGVITEALAWKLLLALRARVQRAGVLDGPVGLRVDDAGALVEVDGTEAWIVADPDHPRGWSIPGPQPEPVPALARTAQLFDLYMPLLVGTRADVLVAAHLAQSLDGRVATASGVSQFISDEPDLVHTHRMRALFDAVVVGACTVEFDDPALTTRHVAGEHPVRVVLDPRGRLDAHRRVFSDGQAPTVLIRGEGAAPMNSEQTTVVEVPAPDGVVSIPALVATLRDRGLRRLFIEGGGVTVSHFLQAAALDRLHVTVAPMIIGSGRPAFTLPQIEDLDDALRLACRHYFLGADILFDCPLQARSS